MKKFYVLSSFTLLLNVFGFGQVQVDKPIDLNSTTPGNARLMGIKQVSAAQDAVSAEVLQKGSLIHGSVTGGTNTYTLTFSPVIATPYNEGMVITFKAVGDNTSAVTLNGIPLKKDVTGALAAGDIKDGQLVTVAYDGSNFQLQSRTTPAAQLNADWNASSGVAQILNKPGIPAAQVNSDWNASSGVAQILNKPSIPAAQVNSDWNATSGVTQILNKPTLTNGTVTGVTGTSPIASTGGVAPDISIANAKADATTKGAASFTTNDFNDNGSGNISLDYANGQKATTSQPGFLASTDFTNFNTAYTSRIATLTTTGNSGPATFSSNTMNIPNYTLSGLGGQAALTFSTGLTNTSNTITANLSTGISGGQTAKGGTAASENLTLTSTNSGTKGKILFGTSAYDEVNNRLGIGNASPNHRLTILNNGQSNAGISARDVGGNAFEWGHGNTLGYGNTIGHQVGNGQPFIAFSAEAGTSNNTYRTRGIAGTVIRGDIAGGLSINTVPTATADNQTLTPLVTVLSNGNVGIGSSATNPDQPLTIINNSEWNIASRSSGTTSTNRNHALFQRANGTSAVSAGFNLGGIAMGGYDGSVYSYGWNGGAEVSAFANQTFTAANRGTYLSLFTTPDNTAVIKEQMRIGADGIVSLTTGVGNIRGLLRAVEGAEYNGANGGSGFIIATSGGENITFKDNGVSGDVNMSIGGGGTVTIPGLGGSGNVQVYADNSGNLIKANSSTPAAGSVVQMKAIQTRTQGTYTSLTTGNGTPITPLDIVITPTKAGNAMVLTWVVNGEMHYNNVYTVTRNGTLLANATDGTNRWSGVASEPYDNDQNSTPSNVTISIIDFNTLSTSTTYSVCVRSSENAATYYLNRTVNNGGSLQFETTLSTGTATEIQQ